MNWRRILKFFKWLVTIVVGLMLLISALILVFKDDIKDYALEEANKYLNKRVHIGYIDVGIWNTFPDMSLRFDDVLIHSKFDTLQTADTAFFSKKLTLSFNPLDFWEENYSIDQVNIEDAVLNLKVLENGDVNYDFIKPGDSTQSTSPFSFELELIELKKTRFTYGNEATQQDYSAYFDALTFEGSFNEKQFTMHAKTEFAIDAIKNKSLTLIEDKQATCDISIGMDRVNNVFAIKDADLTVNKLPFHIAGKVTEDSLNFEINAKQLDLVDVANNFTIQQLDVVNQFNGKGIFNFDLTIEGPLNNTVSPAIDAMFIVQEGSLTDNGFSLSSINLEGSYTNGVRTGQELLTIPSLKFRSMNRSFKGNLRVLDFERPRLIGNADGVVNLRAVHRLFGPFDLQNLSGNLMIDGSFDVRMNTPQVVLNEMEIYRLRAMLEAENITAQFINDSRIFSIPNGEITVRDQQAGFTDFELNVGSSDIKIDGMFNHIADYFKKERNLSVDASISSEQLVLEDLSSNSGDHLGHRYWMLPSSISGKLNLDLTSVKYSGHEYNDIKTQLRFAKHKLIFPYVSGRSAGANLNGHLSITEDSPMMLQVVTDLNSSNVAFAPLFKEWNNFDQQIVTASNIQGNAAINLTFRGPFDLYRNEYDKSKFSAETNIVINDGALKNVSAMKMITESLRASAAKLVLSKKTINNFEEKLLNLEFDSFRNHLTIRDGVLTIPRMTIKSNALDVTLSGSHTFDNVVDYSFSFRFREIKGDRSSEFGDVVDDGTGVKMFLKMTGTIENPVFEWDKEAYKREKKEQREEAKEDLKSALKTGFGINKKDTTVQELNEEKHKEEELIMEFDKDSIQQEFKEQEKEKKKNALQKRIDKWKKENKETESKEVFEIDD